MHRDGLSVSLCVFRAPHDCTATMIQLGKVKGNKMVDMQLSNSKLVDRGA
jgi:hypothetical protein